MAASHPALTNEDRAERLRPRVSGWIKRELKIQSRIDAALARAEAAEARVRELETRLANRGEAK
jgi:hypothetical protein